MWWGEEWRGVCSDAIGGRGWSRGGARRLGGGGGKRGDETLAASPLPTARARDAHAAAASRKVPRPPLVPRVGAPPRDPADSLTVDVCTQEGKERAGRDERERERALSQPPSPQRDQARRTETHLRASPRVQVAVVEDARVLQHRALLDAVERRVLDCGVWREGGTLWRERAK